MTRRVSWQKAAVARLSAFAHPDAPGEGSGIRIGDRAARRFESQLDLSVVAAFVPEHVPEEENRGGRSEDPCSGPLPFCL